MFLHKHPFNPFFPKNATKMIVGTLPPPRFSTGDLKPKDVNFCYGSSDGQLWPILDRLFGLNLKYEDTAVAIRQRKEFLTQRGIAICDIVASAKREKIDASDLGMDNVKLRDMFGYLKKNPGIETILFTGGNSKNGPEYFFRKLAKKAQVKLIPMQEEVPRIYSFEYAGRSLQTVSLTAPSGAANRAVGSMEAYKKMKAKNPDFNTLDFRVLQYAPFF